MMHVCMCTDFQEEGSEGRKGGEGRGGGEGEREGGRERGREGENS